MKNFIFLILILLITQVGLCKQSIGNPFNLTLPDKSYEISKSDYVSQLTSGWKNPMLPKDTSQIQNDHIYKMGNLYLSFIERVNDPILEKDLNGSKGETIDLLKMDKSIAVNYFKIVSVNKIQYLVYEYHDGDEVWLRFRSEYHNDHIILGFIEFKEAGESKAQKQLSKFLNGISLKK
jgi:hypothetical protein